MLLPWSHAHTHARLARRAAAGDVAALAALYRALHPAVHAYVRRRVAAPADAEDLVARVFHRLLEHLSRFDPARAPVRGWVLTIARNLVIDHFRTRRDHAPFDEHQGDEFAVIEPLAWLSDAPDERTAALREHVRELPATTREMLTLHFTDDLHYREIAALLGFTEAAVKQRMARALRELRARLSTVPSTKGAAAHAI